MRRRFHVKFWSSPDEAVQAAVWLDGEPEPAPLTVGDLRERLMVDSAFHMWSPKLGALICAEAWRFKMGALASRERRELQVVVEVRESEKTPD